MSTQTNNKDILASMKAAQANMNWALSRIHDLETRLKTSSTQLEQLASVLPDKLYAYYGTNNSNPKSIKARTLEIQAEMISIL